MDEVLGKVAMATWVADRLLRFANEYPNTLAMTPQVLRDYLAQMMVDATREAMDGTRAAFAIQTGA